MLSVMVKELEAKGPSHLHADLVEVKLKFNKALNSYVHAGIHALSRKQRGFPLPLACQVVQSSNGIGTVAAMMLANLTGDESRGNDINRLFPSFGDYLPQLHRQLVNAP